MVCRLIVLIFAFALSRPSTSDAQAGASPGQYPWSADAATPDPRSLAGRVRLLFGIDAPSFGFITLPPTLARDPTLAGVRTLTGATVSASLRLGLQLTRRFSVQTSHWVTFVVSEAGPSEYGPVVGSALLFDRTSGGGDAFVGAWIAAGPAVIAPVGTPAMPGMQLRVAWGFLNVDLETTKLARYGMHWMSLEWGYRRDVGYIVSVRMSLLTFDWTV